MKTTMPVMLSAFLTVIGYGGGGSSNSSGAAGGGVERAAAAAADAGTPLSGTWSGAVENDVGDLERWRLTISGSRVTALEVDGVDQKATGAISRNDAQVYSFTLTRTGESFQGNLFVDPPVTHLLYLDEVFGVGVLQKGTSALPAYAKIDVNGNWKGAQLTTDFDDFGRFASSAICITQTCSVTEDVSTRDTFTGSFDGTFGRWIGTSKVGTNPGIDTVSRAFLGSDKTFLGVWRCVASQDGSLQFPQLCEYSAWTKQ